MIKTATIVDDSSADDEVGLNKKVKVYFEEDDMCEEYKIVTSIRGNSLEGLLSIESPIGKALIGKKCGDRVLVKVNDNVSYYVVIKEISEDIGDENDTIKSF